MTSESILKEKLRSPISTKELERRWKAAREIMKKHDVSLLIMQNTNQWSVTYLRYFTDIPAECNTPVTMLFPIDEEGTMISSGGKPTPLLPAEWCMRGIKSRINLPYFRGVNYTHAYDAKATVDYIKGRNDKRVGLIGQGDMSAAFYKYMSENLPDVEFVDLSDDMDRFIAVKSEEEIARVRDAVRIQDIICAAMPTIIRPGRYEYEVRNEISHIIKDLGAEEHFLLISSGTMDKPVGPANYFFQNKRIERGDAVYVMIETNGLGGYWAEIARTWVLGEPTRDLVEAYEHAFNVQHIVAEALAYEKNAEKYIELGNEYMREHGFPLEERLIGHGQGYSAMERPILKADEKLEVGPNMNMAIHPGIITPTSYAFACDQYLTTDGAPELLHKTAQKVFSI